MSLIIVVLILMLCKKQKQFKDPENLGERRVSSVYDGVVARIASDPP